MHPVLFDASVTKYSYTWSTLFPLRPEFYPCTVDEY